MRPSRAPSRHKTDKRGSQKSVRQSDCSSTSRLAKDPHVQLASTIDQSLCAVAYLVSKYPQGASVLALVHVSETRHVARACAKGDRQRVSLEAQKRKSKMSLRTKIARRMYPSPNELCETSRVCVAGQGF